MNRKIQLTDWRPWRPRHKLILYLILFITSDITLTIIMTLNALGGPLHAWDEYKTTMTFDGKLIYKEDNLTFQIDNGKKSDSKTLVIYGLNNAASVNITASHITDETTNIFENLNVTIPTTPMPKKNNEDYLHRSDVTINIAEPVRPGSYQGWIFITNKTMNLSIPVNVETGPQVYTALLWVIIGILTSILFWEIIKYAAYAKPNEDEKIMKFKNKDSLKRVEEHRKQLSALQDASKKGTANLDERIDNLQMHIEDLKNRIQKDQEAESGPVDEINKKHETMTKEFRQLIRILKKSLKGKDLEPVEQVQRHLNDEDKYLNKKLHDYINNRFSRKTVPHLAIIDLGSIVFGIIIGFLALLSQGYVTGIRVITPLHILALIGLGLAIGSLRDYVYKASQPG
jgi:hypothetical protein